MILTNKYYTNSSTSVECEDRKNWKFDAPHNFCIRDKNGNNISNIHFQEGPIKEYGVNGISNEDCLLMVLERLNGFQNSQFRCVENDQAITAISEALQVLQIRRLNREKRGVEGTSNI